jgi:hypothetical protein
MPAKEGVMAKKKAEKSDASGESKPAEGRGGRKTSARKTESAPGAAKQPAQAAKQPTQAAKPGPPASLGVPMVDTSLAAAAAARMLTAGRGRRDQGQAEEEKREGSLIKQLKADLNKGAAQSVSNILDKGAPQGQRKPAGLPFGRKQVGHHQTHGPDITRSGVPRRTSG